MTFPDRADRKLEDKMGIFAKSGQEAFVGELYSSFVSQIPKTDDERKYDQGAASTSLPQHIPYGIHEVACVLKKITCDLKCGLLGSMSLFRAFSSIYGKFGIASSPHGHLQAQLIALAITSIGSEPRKSFIVAFLGLASMIGHETLMASDKTGLMNFHNLGVVLGPCLLGDRLHDIELDGQVERSTDRNTMKRRFELAAAVTEMLISTWTHTVTQIHAIENPEVVDFRGSRLPSGQSRSSGRLSGVQEEAEPQGDWSNEHLQHESASSSSQGAAYSSSGGRVPDHSGLSVGHRRRSENPHHNHPQERSQQELRGNRYFSAQRDGPIVQSENNRGTRSSRGAAYSSSGGSVPDHSGSSVGYRQRLHNPYRNHPQEQSEQELGANRYSLAQRNEVNVRSGNDPGPASSSKLASLRNQFDGQCEDYGHDQSVSAPTNESRLQVHDNRGADCDIQTQLPGETQSTASNQVPIEIGAAEDSEQEQPCSAPTDETRLQLSDNRREDPSGRIQSSSEIQSIVNNQVPNETGATEASGHYQSISALTDEYPLRLLNNGRAVSDVHILSPSEAQLMVRNQAPSETGRTDRFFRFSDPTGLRPSSTTSFHSNVNGGLSRSSEGSEGNSDGNTSTAPLADASRDSRDSRRWGVARFEPGWYHPYIANEVPWAGDSTQEGSVLEGREAALTTLLSLSGQGPGVGHSAVREATSESDDHTLITNSSHHHDTNSTSTLTDHTNLTNLATPLAPARATSGNPSTEAEMPPGTSTSEVLTQTRDLLNLTPSDAFVVVPGRNGDTSGVASPARGGEDGGTLVGGIWSEESCGDASRGRQCDEGGRCPQSLGRTPPGCVGASRPGTTTTSITTARMAIRGRGKLVVVGRKGR